MNLTRQDWTLLRGSVAAVAMSVLVSVLLIYLSAQYAAHASKTWHLAEQHLANAKRNLSEAQQAQDNLHNYLQPYQRLQQQHLIGAEPRLNWIESLEQLRLQNLVTRFTYNIGPQKIISPPTTLDTAHFEVHFSDMKLQLELLHEAQLLNFFDALHKQIPGWYQLDNCTLTRVNPTGAGLKADCSGGWLTLQNRSTP
ncbi:MAG: hypothetical protein ACXW1C_01090 [Gallionella sp.]